MPNHIRSVERLYKIASIPGDGIGTEITEAAVQVLDKLAEVDGTFKFEWTNFDWSSKNYLERGWYMPPDGMQQLQKHDAIYFGAVGWPGMVSATSRPACARADFYVQMFPITSPSGVSSCRSVKTTINTSTCDPHAS